VLVSLRDFNGTAGDGSPLVAGRSSHVCGNMLLSKLSSNFQKLRDARVTVWKQLVSPTYFLKDVELNEAGSEIFNELVKCLAFESCDALQVAPSQEGALEALRQLQQRGYVDQSEDPEQGWYVTAAGRQCTGFSRSLGSCWGISRPMCFRTN